MLCGPSADGLDLGREERGASLGQTDRHCDCRTLDHGQPGDRAQPRVAVPLASRTEGAGARRERADFEHVLFYRTSKAQPWYELAGTARP